MGDAIRYYTQLQNQMRNIWGWVDTFDLGLSYFGFEGIQIYFKFVDINSLQLILCK
jgi:hypothetical protein